MRRLIATLLLGACPALVTGPARADDTTTSGLIAERGISGALAQIESAQTSPDRDPDADLDMALAALRFLRGIELAYQARWQAGATDTPVPIPVIATTLAPNPAPEPMRSDFYNLLAGDLAIAMQATRDALPDDGGALVLNLSDIWFDIDGDGARGTEEGLMHLFMMPAPEGPPAAIRFDAADALWLRAYTHLIEGAMNLVLAFDPEPALAETLALRLTLAEQFAAAQAAPQQDGGYFALDFELIADTLATLVKTLRNQPDPERIAEAESHLRRMIAANRDFWTAVATETDDDREWIPNDRQQQALGLEVPQGAGDAWQKVLADAERVLDGELLIPYWRFAPGSGIDLRAWLDDPQPVDLIGWVQGTDALDFASEGEMIDGESWQQFTTLTSGQAGLYMVFFN